MCVLCHLPESLKSFQFQLVAGSNSIIIILILETIVRSITIAMIKTRLPTMTHRAHVYFIYNLI